METVRQMMTKGRLTKFTALVMVWLMISLSMPQIPAPGIKEKDSDDFAVQALRILSLGAVSVAEADAATCQRSPSDNEIAVFVEKDYDGNCKYLGVGDYPTHASIGLKDGTRDWDIISSIKVGKDVWAELYEDQDYMGQKISINSDVSDLADKADKSFDEKISSIKVIKKGKIASVSFNPANPTAGSEATVTVTVENINKNDASSVRLQFYKNNAPAGSQYSIDPGFSDNVFAKAITIPKELSGRLQYIVALTLRSPVYNVPDFSGSVDVNPPSIQPQTPQQQTQQQTQTITSCLPCISAGRAWCVSYGSSGVPQGQCALPGAGCGYGWNAYTSSCPEQLSCQDACLAKYYGYGGGYNQYYNYNQYGTSAYSQAAFRYPVGACYNRALQMSSIMLFYSQLGGSSANAASVVVESAQPIPSPGLCSDPEDVCWCAVMRSNTAYATGTATIPGTTQTKHWPPSDDYYVKSADEPKKSATDADCAQKSTLTLANVRVNNQSARVQTKLIAAGQPITIDGEVRYSSTVCNGYQYTCEKFTVPDVQCDQGREGFLGMTQYKRHKDCAKIYPDMPNKLGGEGEDESFCWGCLADIGIILLDIAAMAFLGMPPNVAIQAAQALMMLTPALDGCPANWVGATFAAANAVSNIPKGSGENMGVDVPVTGGGGNNPSSPSSGVFTQAYTPPSFGVAYADESEVCDVQPNNIDFAELEKNVYLQDELMADNPGTMPDAECVACVNDGGRWCAREAPQCVLPIGGQTPITCFDATNPFGVYMDSSKCPSSTVTITTPPTTTPPTPAAATPPVTTNQDCLSCVNSKKAWCALRDSRGVIVAGVCVDDASKCKDITGATPIVGNPYQCPSKATYGVDDAAVGMLQMLPSALQAWNCDLLKDTDCWSVCGREYIVNATAAPRCNQGGPVKKFTEAQYTCPAPVPCGGLANHPVVVEILQGDTVVKEDTTTTDENGKFSITITVPNINGEVSLIVKSSV